MAVEAANLICEYCEAAIHEILFLRNIYNRDIFQKERLYGIALHKSRHPDLILYISDSILSLKVRNAPLLAQIIFRCIDVYISVYVFLIVVQLPTVSGVCGFLPFSLDHWSILLDTFMSVVYIFLVFKLLLDILCHKFCLTWLK
jgi:hypothetical protein